MQTITSTDSRGGLSNNIMSLRLCSVATADAGACTRTLLTNVGGPSGTELQPAGAAAALPSVLKAAALRRRTSALDAWMRRMPEYTDVHQTKRQYLAVPEEVVVLLKAWKQPGLMAYNIKYSLHLRMLYYYYCFIGYSLLLLDLLGLCPLQAALDQAGRA